MKQIILSSSSFQIQVIEDDKAKSTEPFTTGVRGQAPPLVTTDFQVKDQGTSRVYTEDWVQHVKRLA